MSIREMIEVKARELADHDGVPATIMHLHASASNLGAEIRRELDALVAEFRPVGSPHAKPVVEQGSVALFEQAQTPVAAEAAQICAGNGETAAADARAADDASAPAAAPDAPAEPSESAS